MRFVVLKKEKKTNILHYIQILNDKYYDDIRDSRTRIVAYLLKYKTHNNLCNNYF